MIKILRTKKLFFNKQYLSSDSDGNVEHLHGGEQVDWSDARHKRVQNRNERYQESVCVRQLAFVYLKIIITEYIFDACRGSTLIGFRFILFKLRLAYLIKFQA